MNREDQWRMSSPLELFGKGAQLIIMGQVAMATGRGERLSARTDGFGRSIGGRAGGLLRDDEWDRGGVLQGLEGDKRADGPSKGRRDGEEGTCLTRMQNCVKYCIKYYALQCCERDFGIVCCCGLGVVWGFILRWQECVETVVSRLFVRFGCRGILSVAC